MVSYSGSGGIEDTVYGEGWPTVTPALALYPLEA
jgi:hypothetical protein